MVNKIKHTTPKDVPFSLRLAPDIAEQVKALAKAQRRSYGQTLALMIEESLKAKVQQ